MLKGKAAWCAALMFLLTCFGCSTPRMTSSVHPATDTLLYSLLQSDPVLAAVTADTSLRIQIIYTQIDRTGKGEVKFTDRTFQLNRDQYFYPASSVKFPVSVLALHRLNELNISGLDKNTTMITGATDTIQTEVDNDPSTSNGPPTIAHYIRKILLVSDNDAFNRLYEFLGQEYINQQLHERGYTDVQLIHRLSIALTEEQNRSTNPVSFYDTSGALIYQRPARYSILKYAERNTKLGIGYMKDTMLINEPFDFSKKNRIYLEDLHQVMRSVLFPASVPARQRFNLTADDYQFLYRYMSMYPRESDWPAYDSTVKDNAAKMFVFTKEGSVERNQVRIFSKAGWAYGFLTDVAYIADLQNNVEFMVSATIYCNSDGVFNDDKYDFEKIGYPFFRALGQALHTYELKRPRTTTPDLSSFKIIYSK